MDESRIVLLGKTGSGKSSLANAIFGEDVFKVDHSLNSETRRFQAVTRFVNGKSITLIDTPGFYLTGSPEKELKPDILRCICAPGPHAFLIVLKVEKVTEHEQAVIKKMTEHFSPDALKYAAVVFTHGDDLPEGMTIERFVSENNNLRYLVGKCGDRCHVVDNKYWKNTQDEYRNNKVHMAELLNTIEKIPKKNNGGYYTDEKLQAVEREIQREEECIKNSSGNMSQKEIRKLAKNSICKKQVYNPQWLRRLVRFIVIPGLLAAFTVWINFRFKIFLHYQGVLPKLRIDAGNVFTRTLAVLSLSGYFTFDNMGGSEPMRVVIVGKTGAGKSSLANTIFGDERFKVGHTLKSETSECKAETRSVSGRSITLIDTPGFFDTNTSEDDLKGEIVRCITECAPGPHAFLIVLKVEKLTEQEQDVITKMCQYFSEEALKYATVLFTHGDDLPEGWKVENLICQNKPLTDLVEKCGGRCHIIDNKHWNKNPKSEYRSNEFQVKELLKSIDKMVKTNNGSCYTNDMLQEVEREIQKEMEVIRESSPGTSEREIRKLAKDRIFKRRLKKWACIGGMALIGLLFGVAVSSGLVAA
ncbi:GTPase IMAP family member 8-like [Symphorus nematophorus]